MNLSTPLLAPAPDFRQREVAPPADGLSPEAQDGRLQGKETSINDWTQEKEEPWMTMAAQCIALRMTQKEVAAFLDKSASSVNHLCRATWFQTRIREFMMTSHTKINDLFTSELVPSFMRLVELRDDPKTPKPVVLSAIQEILNRNLGKPLQPSTSDVTHRVGDPVAEVERLKRENEGLRKPSIS